MKYFAREAVQVVAMLSSANCNFALVVVDSGLPLGWRPLQPKGSHPLEVTTGTQEKTYVPLEI